MGVLDNRAAIYAGALTYPPKPTTTSASLITFLDSRTEVIKSNGTFNHDGDGLREIRTRGIRCSSN